MRRRGRRRRRRARRRLGRPLQPQDGPGQRRQPLPRARRRRARPGRRGPRRPGGRAARCWLPTARARSTCTRPTTCWRAPDRLAVRQRGAGGSRPSLAALADHRVRIPIHGRAESLNLATAAALCLYATRPRPAPLSGRPALPWCAVHPGARRRAARRVVLADADGRGRWSPTRRRRMLGIDARAMIGRPLAEVLALQRPRRPGLGARATRPTTGWRTRTGVPEQSWLLPDGTEVLVAARHPPPGPRRPGRPGRRQPPLGPRPGPPRPRALRPGRHRRPRAALAAHRRQGLRPGAAQPLGPAQRRAEEADARPRSAPTPTGSAG